MYRWLSWMRGWSLATVIIKEITTNNKEFNIDRGKGRAEFPPSRERNLKYNRKISLLPHIYFVLLFKKILRQKIKQQL